MRMTGRFYYAAMLSLAIVAAGGLRTQPAAQVARSFTLEQVLGYPFPEHLIASPAGSAIAWTLNERGLRNIYIAEGPEFKPRRLTNYDADDGQELTNLSFSDDGRYLVYVRGGNHEASVSSEANGAPDPLGSPVEPRIQVWSVATTNGEMKLLGEGDSPVVAPRNHRVAFLRDGRIWIALVDGSKPPELVFVHGTSELPAWSPDGATLAFASNRDNHSFIALFTRNDQPIRYIAPSTARDSVPIWSPDGSRIAFVRQPGKIRTPPAGREPEPWAIWVGEVETGLAREVWKSGPMVIESRPRVEGGVNLHWAAGDRLVFLSYLDGWPHLYSVPTAGGPPLLLTPGRFMVEHVSMAPDGRSIVFSANSGTDRDDIDRRHIFRVAVDTAAPALVTSGRGIEWSPVITGDGKTFAYLTSDALRTPAPAILPSGGGPARRLTDDRLPADFPMPKLFVPESVIIQAADGIELHAQVFKSSEGEPRRPALIFVHGGPEQQMLLGWHYRYYYAVAYALNQYLANRGFLVLSVNYRLGIGYGHAFQYPDPGRGASAYDDIVTAAKYLQARQDVDAKRLGIWGGSYGGYLSALALARDSDVFAAGVDIHGLHDLLMRELGKITVSVSDENGDSTPSGPIWTSPVLLIHSDDDRTVPFLETVELEQRLIAQRVPVETRVIPDDIHDFLLFSSWKTVTAATADFLERALLIRPAK